MNDILIKLYQVACWRHAEAQQPWDASSVQFWQGCACGLALALKARGLTDLQLRRLEDQGIILGQAGWWEGLIEELDQPDGTVPHED